MKTMTTCILATAMTLFSCSTALAAPPTAHQAVQAQRIHSGVTTGQLTRAERRGLRAEQRRIAQTRRAMLRDGRLDRQERARLARMQRRSHRHIWRAKHNRRVAR